MTPGGVGNRVGALLAALLVVALAGVGCGRELVGSDSAGGPAVATSPEAARIKLDLLLGDPCYTAADPRAVWPRCGRWAEEAVSTARAATDAVPGDAALAGGARDVVAGRDLFASRGCAALSPARPAGPGPCVAALLSTRTAVTGFAGALRAVP